MSLTRQSKFFPVRDFGCPNPRTSSQPKSPRPNPPSAFCPKSPSPPKSSESPFTSGEVLAAMRLRAFAARLRQPCGGEGSEGRALAIARASGAGWAGAWVARPSRERQTATEPPRADGMGLTSDLQRRRAGLHQHEAQPSPPKPQPRVAAGPAIRVAESQISSDSIGVVDGAVEFLKPNPPLSTMLCYRRANAHGRKNSRRSRACKARHEANEIKNSGRSGFIGGEAERFEGPFVRLRRRRKNVQRRWALALASRAQQRGIVAHCP